MKLAGYDKTDFAALGMIVFFVLGAASIQIFKEKNENKGQFGTLGPVVLATDSARVVLDLMNEERDNVGVAPMQWSPILALTAYDKLQEMEKQHTFRHVLPDKKPFVEIIFSGGYPTRNADGTIVSAGENLSCGYETPESMIRAWMNSEGHRRNILEPRYTEAGISIGMVTYSDRQPCLTAVVHFGTRATSK